MEISQASSSSFKIDNYLVNGKKNLQINFFKDGEIVCNIRIPRQALNLWKSSKDGNVKWSIGNGFRTMRFQYRDLHYLHHNVPENHQVQKLLTPLLMFPDQDSSDGRQFYEAHDDNRISWVINKLSPKDRLCRQLLGTQGENLGVVFVFPDEFQSVKLWSDDSLDLLTKAYGKRLKEMIFCSEGCTKKVYELFVGSQKYDVFHFTVKSGFPLIYRRDDNKEKENVFYKINYKPEMIQKLEKVPTV
eukprot:GHVP01047891.1.p1 GENE.GHVP01047891.1~~GHVP01047891.1.p1  ORF type:complete len:245 (-),score=33.38 GHVP01047891.1:27-761(-)